MDSQLPVLFDTATTVQAPSDELDVASVPELRARLAAAHRARAQVILDLRNVTFMDSAALGTVLAADRRLEADGGDLWLAHVSSEVGRVLRICGLAHLVLPDTVVVLRPSNLRATHLVP